MGKSWVKDRNISVLEISGKGIFLSHKYRLGLSNENTVALFTVPFSKILLGSMRPDAPPPHALEKLTPPAVPLSMSEKNSTFPENPMRGTDLSI